MTTQEILEAARSAKSALALADNTARNAALLGMADALCSADDQAAILAANAEDMAAAKGAHQRCDAGPSGPDRTAH